jgi:hypothetical protein
MEKMSVMQLMRVYRLRCRAGISCMLATGIFFLAASSEKITVAVNDFRGEAIEESSARIITDRIRSELVNSGVFRLIERAEMDNILKEQGFQKSGACDDQTCLVEVGQLLGVDRMIAGSIGKLGAMYTISMRMIDVGSAEIVATVNEDCSCLIEEFIAQSVPAVVRKMIRKLDIPVSEAQKAAQVASAILNVSTSPQGARLSLNGKVMGTTPYNNTHINPGIYTLRLELDGFAPKEESIVLNATSPLELSYALKEQEGKVSQAGKKRKKRIRRIVFGAAAIVAAGAGVGFNQLGEKEYKDYSDLPASTPPEQFDESWKKVDRDVTMRNGAYILSALCAVGFAISIAF